MKHCVVLIVAMVLVAGNLSAQTNAETKRDTANRLLKEAVEDIRSSVPREPEEATRSKLTEALAIFRELHDQSNEGAVLHNLGKLYWFDGDARAALECFTQALPLLHQAGNITGEAMTLIYIGIVYEQSDQLKAVDSYTRALQLIRSTSSRGGEAIALLRLGNLFSEIDVVDTALEYFTDALTLFRANGDRLGQSSILNSMGKIYVSFNEYQRALEYFKESLALARAAGGKGYEASTLSSLGEVYGLLGDDRKALDYYEQALSVIKPQGDRKQIAEISVEIGLIYIGLKDEKRGLEYLNETLRFRQSINDRWGEVITLNGIILAYRSLRENDKAFEYATQLISILNTLNIANGELAGIFYNISSLEASRGNLAEAVKLLEVAISVIEGVSARISNQGLRTKYFAEVYEIYLYYVDLLMQLHAKQPSAGYDIKALQSSERGRARALLQLLTEARADVREGVDETLLARERLLQQKLNSGAQEQMTLTGQRTEEQAKTLAKEIDELTSELQRVEAQIKQTSPRYAALTRPQPLTLKEIQTQLLDSDSILLEYSLGENRSYLWAVTSDSIASYVLPKRDEIEAAARRAYDLLNARNKRIKDETQAQRALRVAQSDKEVASATAALSQMLIAPAAAQLGKKRLVIVADGVLQYIPFASLPSPQADNESIKPQPLIIDHEIVSLPSASTLAVIRSEVAGRKLAPKSVVVLADPVFMKEDDRVKGAHNTSNGDIKEKQNRGAVENVKELQLIEAAEDTGVAANGLRVSRLPGSRKEAEEIMSMVPAADRKLALDFDASRATATSADLSQYRYVHFSTHGFLNSVHPELSGLVFSLVNEKGEPQDGFLRAHEIFNLKLPAELVVLSACQTGIGKEIKGEGLVSLTRGFMYAGAPRVVVSLWSVSENGTAELMVRFYRQMLKEGKRPAAALRSAQISLMKEKKWQAPFYWAAFTLQGEWR